MVATYNFGSVYMIKGYFQSVSSCGKYQYIGDLYPQNFLTLLHIL